MDHLKVIQTKTTFKLTGGEEDERLLEVLRQLHLSNPPELLMAGNYTLTIKMQDDRLARCKKAYFAMVDEWGKYRGYLSRQDREAFKEEVKALLGGESIADMTEPEQVFIKIEELHQAAREHDNYLFPPYNPEQE